MEDKHNQNPTVCGTQIVFLLTSITFCTLQQMKQRLHRRHVSYDNEEICVHPTTKLHDTSQTKKAPLSIAVADEHREEAKLHTT